MWRVVSLRWRRAGAVTLAAVIDGVVREVDEGVGVVVEHGLRALCRNSNAVGALCSNSNAVGALFSLCVCVLLLFLQQHGTVLPSPAVGACVARARGSRTRSVLGSGIRLRAYSTAALGSATWYDRYERCTVAYRYFLQLVNCLSGRPAARRSCFSNQDPYSILYYGPYRYCRECTAVVLVHFV